jgi:hypothetical protein
MSAPSADEDAMEDLTIIFEVETLPAIFAGN